ncbi:MAG: hypothetical protein WD793_05550 [Steroidobacteraceae bacterium]
MAFFIEAGHQNGHRANNYLLRHKDSTDKDISKYYVSHTFAAKKDLTVLQAADLLAWQTAKFHKDKIANLRKTRLDFLSLVEHPHAFVYLTLDNKYLALSIDETPHLQNLDRDRYLKAMFGEGQHADELLENFNRYFETRLVQQGPIKFETLQK